ncbi:hypothetical protein K501DRAFT_333652 [Backusella circina FSU 941]|nr:hypothetical protein K501DRAFT_333652 [Backusella circina FSU 941]
MENLHNRKKQKAPEDQVEFLDEQEQEELLKDLRQQNDNANLSIQRGLIVIGCISTSLFIYMFIQDIPFIPLSHLSTPVISVLNTPRLAACFSLLSIIASIYTLINTLGLQVFGFKIRSREVGKYQLYKPGLLASICMGSVGPVLSLLYKSTMIEFVYWAIPLIETAMHVSAYHMIGSVESSLEELEKSKYKYKGA